MPTAHNLKKCRIFREVVVPTLECKSHIVGNAETAERRVFGRRGSCSQGLNLPTDHADHAKNYLFKKFN